MNNTITIVIPSQSIDNNHLIKIKKAFSHPKNQFLIYDKNVRSLSEIYNEALDKAENNIVIFMHDDIVFETLGLTNKIIKLFKDNPEHGIIGLAGTDELISGCWWEKKGNTYGQVGHIYNGKRHFNKFSKKKFNEKVKDVVVIDGLFMAIDKTRIKHKFDEDFKGFHFYDLPICVNNFNNGVKVGVTTKIKVTHSSVGEIDKKWKKNKLFFEAKFEHLFPMKVK